MSGYEHRPLDDWGWEQADKEQVCRTCGCPLAQCMECTDLALCGDAWCAEHLPEEQGW